MSKEVVAAAKKQLQAEGVDLSGPCGAYAICERSAQMLGAYGVLHKPTGNQCQERATDIVTQTRTDGKIDLYDVLIDGGGANTPTWDYKGTESMSRFRVPGMADPDPPSAPVIPYDEQKSIQFGLGCNDVYKQSGAAFDPGMVSVHSQRAAWDHYVGGLPWEQSYKKHLNEFRAVYGLPPV